MPKFSKHAVNVRKRKFFCKFGGADAFRTFVDSATAGESTQNPWNKLSENIYPKTACKQAYN